MVLSMCNKCMDHYSTTKMKPQSPCTHTGAWLQLLCWQEWEELGNYMTTVWLQFTHKLIYHISIQNQINIKKTCGSQQERH